MAMHLSTPMALRPVPGKLRSRPFAAPGHVCRTPHTSSMRPGLLLRRSTVNASASVQSKVPAELEKIIGGFQMVPDPKIKYQQLLFYAKKLKPMAATLHTEENKVQGCVSQVWVHPRIDSGKIYWEADSDSALTKGLAALLVQGLSGSTADDIVAIPPDFIDRLGLQQSLTPSRNNGFLNMFRLMQRKSLQLLQQEEHGPQEAAGMPKPVPADSKSEQPVDSGADVKAQERQEDAEAKQLAAEAANEQAQAAEGPPGTVGIQSPAAAGEQEHQKGTETRQLSSEAANEQAQAATGAGASRPSESSESQAQKDTDAVQLASEAANEQTATGAGGPRSSEADVQKDTETVQLASEAANEQAQVRTGPAGTGGQQSRPASQAEQDAQEGTEAQQLASEAKNKQTQAAAGPPGTVGLQLPTDAAAQEHQKASETQQLALEATNEQVQAAARPQVSAATADDDAEQQHLDRTEAQQLASEATNEQAQAAGPAKAASQEQQHQQGTDAKQLALEAANEKVASQAPIEKQ